MLSWPLAWAITVAVVILAFSVMSRTTIESVNDHRTHGRELFFLLFDKCIREINKSHYFCATLLQPNAPTYKKNYRHPSSPPCTRPIEAPPRILFLK